jgi:hypothetical protein
LGITRSNSNSFINIPTTIQTIGEGALISANIINTLHLPDAIESIGEYAFYMCSNFANFRCPPLVATTPRCIFSGCKRVFSVEIPEHIILIEDEVFNACHYLRNCALSHGTVMGRGVFINCTDLLRVFDTVEAIIIALSSRFDGFIIHKMCYHKSYHPMALLDFIRSTSVSSGQCRVMPSESNLIESGKQQDCLGMTPLHILACSTVHHLEIYSFVIDQYPETLIMEDAWGAVPLLYAIWGSAPCEIVNLLASRYQYHYPNHAINWSMMIMTLGRVNAPPAVIQNLLDVHHCLCPEQVIDWSNILTVVGDRVRGLCHRYKT